MALKIIGWSMVSRFRASKRWWGWGGRSTPMRAGSWRRTTFPMGGSCALVRVAPYPRAQPWGLRPRRHRGFGVVTYVRVPEFTSHSYVHVHTTNTVRHVHTTLSAARNEAYSREALCLCLVPEVDTRPRGTHPATRPEHARWAELRSLVRGARSRLLHRLQTRLVPGRLLRCCQTTCRR